MHTSCLLEPWLDVLLQLPKPLKPRVQQQLPVLTEPGTRVCGRYLGPYHTQGHAGCDLPSKTNKYEHQPSPGQVELPTILCAVNKVCEEIRGGSGTGESVVTYTDSSEPMKCLGHQRHQNGQHSALQALWSGGEGALRTRSHQWQ